MVVLLLLFRRGFMGRFIAELTISQALTEELSGDGPPPLDDAVKHPFHQASNGDTSVGARGTVKPQAQVLPGRGHRAES
jgi:hypothetical protein